MTADPTVTAAPTRAKPSRRLPRSAAFAVTALTFVLILAAAGSPAPLYIVYQQRFGIPDAGLTAAFAIYIAPVAAALLFCGRLSDHVGRRPVAVLAPLLGMVACVVLINVHGLWPPGCWVMPITSSAGWRSPR